MLPFRTGTLVLSEASKEKLDRFYRRFISGSGNHLDAVNHIIYACHAAMPLLISPELANLTWLNFNTYVIKGKMQKIDHVVVSDFLLSPLVRPVGGRQYELIPEIRTYLLYLLNDNKWFRFLGIESFGPERLTTLANFLRQYLADKRSASENNAAGFREINDWAAMAYLYPNELAIEIAKAYESTFADPEKINEKGQLRLNMIMERFGQQVSQNIHVGGQEERRVFVNMQSYSKANKSILFNESTVDVSNMLYEEVDDEFLDIAKTDQTAIQLPLKKGIGQRLNRKKNKVQRILPLLAGVDSFHEGMVIPGVASIMEIEVLFKEMAKTGRYVFNQTQILRQNEVTIDRLFSALETLFNSANDEDIVVVAISGRGLADSSSIQLADLPAQSSPGIYTMDETFLKRSDFKEFIREKRKNSRFQLVLFLDAETKIDEPWVFEHDIQISATKNHYGKNPSDFFSSLDRIIGYCNAKISYADLSVLLNYQLTNLNVSQKALLHANSRNADKYFFSSERVSGSIYFLSTSKDKKMWDVIYKDFESPAINTKTDVFSCPEPYAPTDSVGEMHVRENKVVFIGNTERLDENHLYVSMPETYVLQCILTDDQGRRSGDEELTRSFFDDFKPDRYSPLKKNLDFWQELDSDTPYPRLFISSSGTTNKLYTLTYIEEETSKSIKWTASTHEAVHDIVRKNCRYFYLSELTNPLSSDSDRLNLIYRLWWAHEQTEGGLLELNQYTINIEDGEVLIKPLSLTITSREEFTLFCKIYLLLPDLSILDITTPDIAMLSPMRTAELIIGDQQLLQQIFTPGNPSNIKVLTSKTPIIVDFSQTGISKNSAHGNRKPQ